MTFDVKSSSQKFGAAAPRRRDDHVFLARVLEVAAVKSALPSLTDVLCKIDGAAPRVEFAQTSMSLFARKAAPTFPAPPPAKAYA